MSEVKKVDVKFEEGQLVVGVDTNKDGDKVLEVKVKLSEALAEVLNKGEKIEGAKVAALDFAGSKLKLKVDTDKDGEHAIELELSLLELLDEVGVSI